MNKVSTCLKGVFNKPVTNDKFRPRPCAFKKRLAKKTIWRVLDEQNFCYRSELLLAAI